MDPLTHTILGAATSYALFGQKLGRRAAGVGALAGAAPDVDNFISSTEDPLLYVEFHRFFTHSLAFALVGSLIAVLPWILRKRFRPEWKLFWLCALPAYLSHCLLDASTTYGTQLFWPFSRERVGWDLISIIDPIFSLTLLALLFTGLWKQRRGFVIGGLIFAAAYLGLGGVQKVRAAGVQRELAEQRGHRVVRSEVMPTLGNNLVWRSLYLANGRIYADRIRVGWFSSSTYREGTSLPLITPEDLNSMERRGNKETRAFERFAWFSDGWVARSPFDETVIGDMRYSLSSRAFDPIWGIRFVSENESIRVEWVERSRDRKVGARDLWLEISGRDPDYRTVVGEAEP